MTPPPHLPNPLLIGGVLFAAGALIAVVFSVADCAPATRPSILNPDPVHGGACRDGNQECQVCADGNRCDPPKACNIAGHCDVDPTWYGPGLVNNDMGKARDAGADR